MVSYPLLSSSVCFNRLDIAFLLEGGKISSSNFQRSLRFIKKLVMSFPRARFGLVSYSKRSTKVFGFYRYFSFRYCQSLIVRLRPFKQSMGNDIYNGECG